LKTNAARLLDALGIAHELRDYQVTIELFDIISMSAGTRGTQILLAPADYLRATKAKLGHIARR
jgi:prolyl-tRNA editing enzyme YbaK/EbsC (Cys-tRNA(Pro) deacylase)